MKNASAHKSGRVLVVGTTTDYVDWIRSAHPQRALFLTAPELRNKAVEESPSDAEEILVDPESRDHAAQSLAAHLETHGQYLTGVACFDCEALEPASVIAESYGLEFPAVEAVRNCRDKYASKVIWQENQVPCPAVAVVDTVEDALDFFETCEDGIVLKPLCGAGSELVFRCCTTKECKTYFKSIQKGLKDRRDLPLFKNQSAEPHLMLAEAYVEGAEYSCDVFIEGKSLSIIRMAEKIKRSDRPFGTASGYVVPPVKPIPMEEVRFKETLRQAANALGISYGICMVDFIFRKKELMLIEMTPRPGGDCLPDLLKTSSGLDILGMTLDAAEKKKLSINGYAEMPTHVGLRIHAKKAGILKGLSLAELDGDKRVKSIRINRRPGHCITMPPKDYDSWLLGHIIIKPDHSSFPETQSFLIQNRLKVEIEECQV